MLMIMVSVPLVLLIAVPNRDKSAVLIRQNRSFVALRDKYLSRNHYVLPISFCPIRSILYMFLANLIERLAELFPEQDYSNRLEQYIAARQPKTAAEVEYWQRQFESQDHRGFSL